MNAGKPWSGIVFAFVVGVIVGGIVMAVLVRTHVVHVLGGRPPIQEMIGKRLTGNLGLTAEERSKLSQILDEYGPTFEALRDSSRAEVQKTAAAMEGRMREILSPGQQSKFDLNAARMHEELRKHEERERRRTAPQGGQSGSAR